VRFVYVDEAGTSKKEPVAVVAAVIIQADDQWRKAEKRLEDIRQKYLPDNIRNGFIFHAKELFSGGKLLSNKTGWSLEMRLPIIKEILAIPFELDFPVAFGFVRSRPDDRYVARHLLAFSICIKAANDLIRVNFKDEIAIVIAEDVTHMRGILKKSSAVYDVPSAPQWLTKHPYDTVVDRIHFAEKTDAPLLQIADHCAFALRHYLSSHKQGEEILSFLDPTILQNPPQKEWPFGMGFVTKDVSKWRW